jgi:archaemetzincin
VSVLYIVGLGHIDEDVSDSISVDLCKAYGFEIRRLAGLPEPAFAFDAQRKQYSSVHILRDLLNRKPEGETRLLGITEVDLFIPMLSFVLGQAQLGGPTALISVARLRQEFYGLPADRPLLRARAVKEAVHEIGHTFGLTHCTDSTCPMSLSNHVRHVDTKGTTLCSKCRAAFLDSTKHLRAPDTVSGDAGYGQ